RGIDFVVVAGGAGFRRASLVIGVAVMEDGALIVPNGKMAMRAGGMEGGIAIVRHASMMAAGWREALCGIAHQLERGGAIRASGSGLKKPQAGTPVLRSGAFPGVQAPCETVGKSRHPIFETTSGIVLGWRGPQRGYPATAVTAPGRYPATAVTAPGRYPATAVTAPGRYAARPAYAAAPLEKRGRPARAGSGARGPRPALRVGRESSSVLRTGIEPRCGSRPPCVLANHPARPFPGVVRRQGPAVPNFAALRADFAYRAKRRDPREGRATP